MSEACRIIVDCKEAAASVAYRSNEVIAIYPITPSSPQIALLIDHRQVTEPVVEHELGGRGDAVVRADSDYVRGHEIADSKLVHGDRLLWSEAATGREASWLCSRLARRRPQSDLPVGWPRSQAGGVQPTRRFYCWPEIRNPYLRKTASADGDSR